MTGRGKMAAFVNRYILKWMSLMTGHEFKWLTWITGHTYRKLLLINLLFSAFGLN